jgi:outer membrane lipoprotein
MKLSVRWLSLAVLAYLLAHLAGCASPLSRDVLGQTTPGATLAEVLAAPERHLGQVVLIAGNVLRVENRPDGTRLEILAYPTSERGFPNTSEPALGRVSLHYPGYLDRLIYQPGRQVSAAGRVIGTVPATADAPPQPLLAPLELALLPESPTYYSPVHIGIGFSFGF